MLAAPSAVTSTSASRPWVPRPVIRVAPNDHGRTGLVDIPESREAVSPRTEDTSETPDAADQACGRRAAGRAAAPACSTGRRRRTARGPALEGGEGGEQRPGDVGGLRSPLGREPGQASRCRAARPSRRGSRSASIRRRGWRGCGSRSRRACPVRPGASRPRRRRRDRGSRCRAGARCCWSATRPGACRGRGRSRGRRRRRPRPRSAERTPAATAPPTHATGRCPGARTPRTGRPRGPPRRRRIPGPPPAPAASWPATRRCGVRRRRSPSARWPATRWRGSSSTPHSCCPCWSMPRASSS
ncbi:MAG: hypothetical protein JWN97_4012 [Nocardioides sp.]|nr:hypothetical protein [Nocardioides sp.]